MWFESAPRQKAHASLPKRQNVRVILLYKEKLKVPFLVRGKRGSLSRIQKHFFFQEKDLREIRKKSTVRFVTLTRFRFKFIEQLDSESVGTGTGGVLMSDDQAESLSESPLQLSFSSEPDGFRPGGSSSGDSSALFIVGVGASAGGLEALERLFEGMPLSTGMAFVVIQHLSPDYKSLTDELLARRTPIPIRQVEDGMRVEANAIYLLPPKKDMILSDGRLLLTDKDRTQSVALPIDRFFRSLAQDAGAKAIGVILSGTGSDGSRGIRDIHEAGGLVVAQSPESAKFDGMPNSAIKTGTVDFSYPPEEIPAALLRHIKHPLGGTPLSSPLGEMSPAVGMEAILRRLRVEYGIDFSHYKPDTVARRTERRLAISKASSIDEYAGRLETDPDELNLLYRDLLIGVTEFFRDEEAFAHLEADVLPELICRPGREEEFRVWIAGCATGEEAYSLAISIHEVVSTLERPLAVKIFATDVHRTSLDFAGVGIYSRESVADVSPERLDRYFVRHELGYQVSPELRKMIVFAQHNVLKDAPFTKIDLISCRNLLIYFQPPAQKKVISLFHFGLKTGGTLFLGPSESPGELGDEFDATDIRWKLYRKRRDVRLPTDIRLPAVPGPIRSRFDSHAGGLSPAAIDAHLIGDALLDECMPTGFLINEHREVVRMFSGANRYLKLRSGWFSNDILELVDDELRMALAGAVPRALKEMRSVIFKGLRVRTAEGESLLNVSIKPIRHPRAAVAYALVRLEDIRELPRSSESIREIDLGQASKDQLISLEAELRYTKENLQALIEEMETGNEELQATNEELVASNEELQSTNEELHSVNEELYTVNSEHQKKIAELMELTTDMENLLTSTDVHTIFLDHNLSIRKFTPKIAETFNLLPQDIGRRIDNFTYTIDHPSLLEDVKSVLATGVLKYQQVRDRRGNWFLLRILPYRAGLSIAGVVLTLIDIGRIKAAEAETRRKDEQLASILRNSPNLIFIKDLQGRYQVADDSFRRILGVDPIGKTVHDIFRPDIAEPLAALDRRVLSGEDLVEAEVGIPIGDQIHTYLSIMFPIRDESGQLTGIGGIRTDVTQLKVAESRAREAVAQRDRFLAMLSHELRNPLAAVLNASKMINHAGLDSPTANDWFQVIERRSRHMARLLDDLLDIARITQNKIEIRREYFDLDKLVENAVEEVAPWFRDHNIELAIDRSKVPLFLLADPARIHQIQVNLLMNAAKYTSPGGNVWYSTRREGGEAVITVKDTGVGMSRDLVERAFELFEQADETLDRSDGGIGVGLTLVRSIVELHGGSVKAKSDGLGLGSEFIVRLPLAQGVELPAEVSREPSEARPPQISGGRRVVRIVIVEDDKDIRRSLAEILRLDGHDIRTADDGAEGLQLMESDPPDCALVDLGIPEISGYELATRLRARFSPAELTLVAMTGYGRPSDREAALQAGFDHHLTKPCQAPDLDMILAAVADRVAKFEDQANSTA